MSSRHHTKTHTTRTASSPSAIVAGTVAALARLIRVPGRGAPSHRRIASLLAAPLLVAGLLLPAAAQAEPFGIHDFRVSFTDAEGEAVTQAGAHPFQMEVAFGVNTAPRKAGGVQVSEPLRDLLMAQAPGFVGNPTAVERCSDADFLTPTLNGESVKTADCPDSTAVGVVGIEGLGGGAPTPTIWTSVFNLHPPPGVAAKLGFWTGGVPVTIELGVNENPPYNIVGGPTNVSEIVEVAGSRFILWGVPADPAHDALRGFCVGGAGPEPTSFGKCGSSTSEVPFLTLPRSCEGTLHSSYRARSWVSPVYSDEGTASSEGMGGCGKLGFAPKASSQPSSAAASSPSGLDFTIDTDNPGLESPSYEAASNADISKAVVTLPKGMTINPSQAEGLETCSEEDLAKETAFSSPGEGCPQASKVGTVEVDTPILENHTFHGAVFVAAPYQNRFGTLLALYMVIRDPELGVLVKMPLKVEPDATTGQLRTISEEIPPIPFSHFKLHLREGGRSPLITPPGCGSFQTEAKLYPSTGGAPTVLHPSFQIVAGPGGGGCPSGDAGFEPGFEAGTRNNAAGHYSPFDMRITRGDGEQDITKFSSVLPPGVLGRLAGTSWCPESGIARAKSRTGENGGTDERNDPSCPADSKIGTTTAGAGVGGQLTYVPGSLYLAGPYNGAPLSVVAITPAVAGPFDAGTVVVREGLTLNPVTGVAEVDGAASDPIPHILKGIPLNLRELRVAVDKPQFTFNSTSCAESQAKATLWGGGTALAPMADSPTDLASRYQASSCASLAFKPRLAIRLYGGVKRGQYPAVRAVVRPRPGQANFRRAAVTLPRSAFLEQGHIRTVCTRVQFAAGAGHGERCPKGAVYGHAKAWSPLVEGPATGPVYLRSSNHKLPDLVVALKGPDSAPVDIELSSRIDSVKGGIRSTFTGIPDLPVSRFVLNMQGGKKGLIVNSRNLCFKPKRNKARANLLGHNGRKELLKPRVVSVKCAKRRKAKRKHKKAHGSHARAARVSTAG